MSSLTGKSPPARAVVLGAAAVDWVARVSELPQPDEITWVSSCRSFPGGSGGNIAAGLGRLGVPTTFAGRLGDDEGGQLLLADFKAAGVDTRGVRLEPGQRSAACFIAVDGDGARQIYAFGGTALYEDPGDLEPDWFDGAGALIIADAFPEVALAAAALCPPAARVICNPGGLMVSRASEWFDPLLACHPVLIASRREAEQLSGFPDPASATRSLMQKGFPVVVQTLGGNGALLGYGERIASISAAITPTASDTTGAGDAFTAGFTAGLLNGMDWVEAVYTGVLTAGAKVRHLGARSGIPGWMELVRTRQENPMRIEEVVE